MSMMIHVGGKHVDRRDLPLVATPDATGTWHPVPHDLLATELEAALDRSGYEVTEQQHALARDGKQYFGFYQIARPQMRDLGYTAMVGLRNSHDQSLPVGIVGGSHVFVCDNLAFSGEIKLFRKHTKNVLNDLDYRTWKAMTGLASIFEAQDRRYSQYRSTVIDQYQADHIAIELLRSDALPQKQFPKLIEQWRQPAHEEHTEGGWTAWRLFNAATEALKSDSEGSLVTLPRRTQTVQDVIDKCIGGLPAVTPVKPRAQLDIVFDELEAQAA
jgi:hypothetical protein